jgi:acetoin utilization deacetylase AcuC-like enzyme
VTLPIIHSETYKLHAPTFEIWPGGRITEYFESPQRVEIILNALRSTGWADVRTPDTTTLDPIAAVHDADYVAFIKEGYGEWLATNPTTREGSPPTYYPAYFSPPRWRHKPSGPKQEGSYGYYTFDLTAPLVEGTYEAVVGSAQCAMTAANLILDGQPVAYALCRPPGHHAGRDFSGGYCYFNNTAIAARLLSAHGPVAILDIDYHHGNGTQDIFWEDDQVLTISIHCDPRVDFPYFTGYADEIGAGAGWGHNLNLPLLPKTDGSAYLAALDTAIDCLNAFQPWALVVAAGFDTFGGDPISKFALTTADYGSIAQRIRSIGIPAVIVQEGGYNTEALGRNAVAFLEPFATE